MDPLGEQDPVGGNRPGSRDLIPRHYLGAIVLADTLYQGPPLGQLLGRGVGGSIAMAVASLTPTADRPSSLVPSQLRTIAQALWRSQTPSRHEKAFCASSCSTHTCDYFPQPPQQN